jgi:tRNA(Ile)-lysidine synthetase-like protein
MNGPEKILRSVRAALAEVPSGARAWIAVSGGLDSMTLLEAVHRAGARGVVVAHVNHALRGAESDADEAHVQAAAAARGYAFHRLRIEWNGEHPSQAACRRRREVFFASAMGERDLLFLAHHADDQAETIMLRLLRGTGLDGLGGIKARSGIKRRPLLAFPRSAIHAAAETWGVHWREDSSNLSAKYDRNWLRHEIFPRLEARRPGFAGRLAALGEELQARAAPRVAAPLFTFGEFRFAKRAELLVLGERGLKTAFGLDRAHTRSLAALLAKGSGECAAPRRRFRLSQGVLVVEQGTEFRDELAWREGGAGRVAESALGSWRFAAAAVGSRREVALGASAKKKFQAAKVPVFFRDSLPVLPGAEKIFLPTGAACTPSPLAEWWLSS